MQIHISRNGETYGPYTPAQIELLIHAGQVEATDEVWVQSSEWEPMTALQHLFGAPGGAPHGKLPPEAASRCDIPPLAIPVRDAGQSVLAATPPSARLRLDEEEEQENLMRMSFGL
jgi:hypothetical protein